MILANEANSVTIGAKFVLIEVVFGLVGLALAKLLLPTFSGLWPRINRESTIQALAWAILPIAVGVLLASPLAATIPGAQTIRALFAKEPMSGFVKNTSLPTLVLFAVSAGTAEELLFRGVLQTRWGLWIASLIFAAMHSVSLPMFINAFWLGVYFGVAFRRSGGNLFVSALPHACCDLTFLLCLRYIWIQ